MLKTAPGADAFADDGRKDNYATNFGNMEISGVNGMMIVLASRGACISSSLYPYRI